MVVGGGQAVVSAGGGSSDGPGAADAGGLTNRHAGHNGLQVRPDSAGQQLWSAMVADLDLC